VSTAPFQKKVMTSIDAICEARRRKEDRLRRNGHVNDFTETRKDQNSPTVSSEARQLHDYVKGVGIGNTHVQVPTEEEIHGFLSEATKNFEHPPKYIDEAINTAKSRGLVLSSILEMALMLEY